jgi:hypothetical protein
MVKSSTLVKIFLLSLIFGAMATSVLSRSVKRDASEAEAEALEDETMEHATRTKRQLGMMGGLGGLGGLGGAGLMGGGLMGGGLMGGGGGILDLLVLSSVLGGGNGFGNGFGGGNGGRHRDHGRGRNYN